MCPTPGHERFAQWAQPASRPEALDHSGNVRVLEAGLHDSLSLAGPPLADDLQGVLAAVTPWLSRGVCSERRTQRGLSNLPPSRERGSCETSPPMRRARLGRGRRLMLLVRPRSRCRGLAARNPSRKRGVSSKPGQITASVFGRCSKRLRAALRERRAPVERRILLRARLGKATCNAMRAAQPGKQRAGVHQGKQRNDDGDSVAIAMMAVMLHILSS